MMIGKSDQSKDMGSQAGRRMITLFSDAEDGDIGPVPNKGVGRQEEGFCNILETVKSNSI